LGRDGSCVVDGDIPVGIFGKESELDLRKGEVTTAKRVRNDHSKGPHYPLKRESA
jgi:hypothetical protein